MTNPSPTAIAATGLHKSYGDTLVLDGIDLRVPTGTTFALLGPNGAAPDEMANGCRVLSTRGPHTKWGCPCGLLADRGVAARKATQAAEQAQIDAAEQTRRLAHALRRSGLTGIAAAGVAVAQVIYSEGRRVRSGWPVHEERSDEVTATRTEPTSTKTG